MHKRLWIENHAALLRQAMFRDALTADQLAKLSALSTRQVMELMVEDSSGYVRSSFYSESIKFHAGVLLLKKLGETIDSDIVYHGFSDIK